MELMSPIDALFLSAESREHPLHVGALQLFEPPAGAGRGLCGKPIRRCFSAAR